MVTEPTLKTGYWRINPATGEREWIEGSYQPKKPKLEKEEEVEVAPITPPPSPLISSKELYRLDKAWADWSNYYARTGRYPDTPAEMDLQPYFETWKQAIAEWEATQPEMELAGEIRPEVPTVDVTELAKRYGVSVTRFVSTEQLADLALPPAERTVQWQIPYEQYLTAEQAKWLGFDIPEGYIVRMTPMAEGEPSFFLMPEPTEVKALPDEELVAHLREAYPLMFDPAYSYGFSIEEIPGAVVSQLQQRMTTDYVGFVEDLYSRVGSEEAENILRLLGVTEENILLTLDFRDQEARVETIIGGVFPDFANISSFGRLIETDFELFVETIQTGGSSPEKRTLLEFMGYNPDEINSFFSVQRLMLDIDGVRQQIIVDTPTMKAYDYAGRWIGSYNVVTKEFESLPDEGLFKDFVDSWRYSLADLYHTGKQFVVSALPNFLFRDMGRIERNLYGDDYVNKVNAGNKIIRDEFRRVYALNQKEFDDWVTKHPDLAPNPMWGTDTAADWKDSAYWFYQFAQSTAYMAAVMGSTIGVTALTANPALGLTTGITVATPLMAQETYDVLLAAGATEAQAGQLALPIGVLMSIVEVVGDMPWLRQVAPGVFRSIRREATRELSERTVLSLTKKGLRTFTTIEIIETLEEVAQQAIQDAAVKSINENKVILADLDKTVIESLVVIAPIALLGGGKVAFQRVPPSQTQGLSDAEMVARGWEQDPETGHWYERLREVLRDERGFVIPAGEPERVSPEAERVAWREQFKEIGIDFDEIIRKEEQAGQIPAAVDNLRRMFKFIEDYARISDPRITVPDAEIAEMADKLRGMVESHIPALEEEGTVASERVLPDLREILGGLRSADRDVQVQAIDHLVATAHRVEPTVLPRLFHTMAVKGETIARIFDFLAETKKLPELPMPEPGMPEAGIQPAMIPEVLAKEVRPPGKGEVVQISMEDQLKLAQARQAAEEAPEDVKGAYEAQAEIEGLRAYLEVDPVAQKKVIIGKDKRGKDIYRGLDFFISLREQTFPEYFTVKQAMALYPALTTEPFTQPGTPQYNRVPRDVALDDLTKQFNMTPDEIADRVMAIRKEKRRIKELEARITEKMTEKPLAPQTDLTTAEVTENWQTIGRPKLTLKQVNALVGFFADYLNNPGSLTAWELSRELRRETRAGRAEALKVRAQELIVKEGLGSEEAIKQAISDTMAGELPTLTTEYFAEITNELRDALFAKVYHVLKAEPYEMMSTATALTNALTGRPIPREPGPTGRSAYTRLQRVFGDQPKVLKAIEKMAKEKKPLEDVVEGIYHEIGKEPIPVDQETADYLRNISTLPLGQAWLSRDAPTLLKLTEAKSAEQIRTETEQLRIELAREPIPVAKYEAPIEDAIKQVPMWPTPMRDNIIKVLKEVGYSPIDIGNFLRANKASVDFSFWRQQAPLILNHPVSFTQANVEAWKALWSQKSAEASWERITQDPLFHIYDQINIDFLRPLELAKGTSQWRGVEEFGYITGERLIPRLTGKIPWVKLSARAFVTGTNEHNWRIFKNHYNAMLRLGEKYASGEKKLKPGEVFSIEKEMTDMAKLLTDLTARGQLGRVSGLAPALSSMFFAPRMALGRILSPRHLVSANPRIRIEAWRDLVTFVGGIGGIVLLGALLGLWEVEKDPRSAEYMSIRIGTTRLDPWGGYRQYLVFLARAITGTGLSSVTGAEYRVDPLGSLTHFIRGKAAPMAAIITDFWVGRTFVGEEVDVANKKQWIERIAPFAVWDIFEAYMEDPTTAFQVAIPAIVGAGVQTYTGDWAENWPKLGLPKYSDNLVYGITEPYYDTADFWSDTSAQFKDVDLAKLTKEKGFPEYIRALAEARLIKEHLDTLPNQKLVRLNADPAEGTTFVQYRQMWLDREKLVLAGDDAELTKRELQPDGTYKKVTYKGEEALKAFDQDEKTRNAHLGNFSQRQFALLNEYWAITDPKKQAEFLKKHESEIGINPRQDWLRSHPKENAQLAVWGQAKILTKEAYTEFNSLVKSLDIPDNAIPELTLPPETSIDTHFTYEEMVVDGKHMSWEAQLLLLKDAQVAEGANVLSYAEWRGLQLSETPIAALEIKVANRELTEQYEALETDKERTQFKTEHPAWVDDMRRIEAIEKGSEKAPISEELVNHHVEYGQILDQEGIGPNSAEAMLFRVDNPAYNDFRMDTSVWDDQVLEEIDEYRIPIWRIDVQYKVQDTEYDALPVEGDARENYLAGNEDYRKARRTREAYELLGPEDERFPSDMIDTYVAYYEMDVKGFKQERFLVNNPAFADAMHRIKGIDLPDPAKVPAVQYDLLYDQYQDKFDRLEGLADNKSEFYIEDVEQREIARSALRFDAEGNYTEFGLAEIRRNAYGAFVPDKYVEAYVGYYKIIGEGKPEHWKLDTGTDLWYEDDWFLMENIEFYREVYVGLLGNERKDFRKIPSREVFNLYLTYIALPHLKAKDDFRWNNRELDAWLVIKFDYTPIVEKKRREDLTPYELFIEKWEERGKEIEEGLKALRE